MATATIPLRLNDKGQATPEDALRTAIQALDAVKIDYTGMTEEQIGRLRRLASSLQENASHVVGRARKELTSQLIERR